MVTADQRQIIREVTEQLRNSFGLCQAQDVPARYVPQLLTAEWQKHCLYIDSDLLECADDKSIKILLLEIKKQCLLLFQSARYCAHEESQGQTLHWNFLCINAKFLPQCSSP